MAYRTPNGRFATLPSPARTPEQTGKQSDTHRWGGSPMFQAWLWAPGGSLYNPMGWPNYLDGYYGTYGTYTWMLQHPTIQLVNSIATNQILASVWEYRAAGPKPKGVSAEWIEFVKYVMNRLRRHLLEQFFVEGRNYGWAPGEVLWKPEGATMVIDYVKPLHQDNTEILIDKFGNPIQLRNHIPPEPGVKAIDIDLRYKGWMYRHTPSLRYFYGRSWLENIRETAWKMWLDAAQQLQKIAAKIAGVVTVIRSPAGTFQGPPDEDGNPTEVSYRDSALAGIEALAKGAMGLWFPSLALTVDQSGNVDALKVLVELAGKSLTDIELVDFSGNAQAISPVLDRMKHAEELMFHGGLRSPRVGLEGEHGTKAEAGVHTDTGTINAENEDEHFASCCQPLVDALLEVNYGEKARGTVIIHTPSLVDRKTSLLRAFLLALMNEPAYRQEMGRTVNSDKILASLDIEQSKPFDNSAVKPPEPKPVSTGGAPRDSSRPEPEGGRPSD